MAIANSWLGKVATLIGYVLPSLAASHYIGKVSGGVLLVPSAWRLTVATLLLGLGLTVFYFCLNKGREGKQKPRVQLKSFRRKHVFYWLSISMVILIVYLGLSMGFLREVKMDRGRSIAFHNLEHLLPESGKFAGINPIIAEEIDRQLDHLLKELGPPMYLERRGENLLGKIIIPPWFPQSEVGIKFREALLASEFNRGGDWVSTAIRYEPQALIDLLRSEGRLSMFCIVVAFLLIHTSLILSASAAYGYSFSAFEGWMLPAGLGEDGQIEIEL